MPRSASPSGTSSLMDLSSNHIRLSLAQLRAMPARTQITRHDCVEGWSAIGKWTGVPLKLLMDLAGTLPTARYAVFHCADDFDGDFYYESIDLVDAVHPQTILAWGMNDDLLSVGHGAPLRFAGRTASLATNMPSSSCELNLSRRSTG